MQLAAVTSEREKYSAVEWGIRVNLAACYRLAAHFRWDEIVYTHITARVPGEGDQFLINPFGLMFDEITASNLVKVDVDGKILEPTSHQVQEAGFVIHSAIHMARPDVQCVLHNHTRAGMTFSMLKEGLMPLSQHAMMFHGKVAYHDSEGFAVDLEERKRLADDLGDKPVMILRNHGPLIAAATIPQAFNMMFNLQKAMESQLDALATGRALNIPPEQVAEQISGYVYRKERAGQELTDTVDWPALLRMLDRKDPSFRD